MANLTAIGSQDTLVITLIRMEEGMTTNFDRRGFAHSHPVHPLLNIPESTVYLPFSYVNGMRALELRLKTILWIVAHRVMSKRQR